LVLTDGAATLRFHDVQAANTAIDARRHANDDTRAPCAAQEDRRA
jgi:hypothetical protein